MKKDRWLQTMLQYLVGEGGKGGGNAKSALGKGLHLKHAHGAVPNDSLTVLQLCLEALQGFWTNVQALYTCTDMSTDAQACSCPSVAAAKVTAEASHETLHSLQKELQPQKMQQEMLPRQHKLLRRTGRTGCCKSCCSHEATVFSPAVMPGLMKAAEDKFAETCR